MKDGAPWWIGPCVVDDPSDALLFSIFELVWPERSLHGEEDMPHQAILAGGHHIVSKTIAVYRCYSLKCFQPACIDQHASDQGVPIVNLRLALPNVEPGWPLLLDPIAYSSSRWRTFSVRPCRQRFQLGPSLSFDVSAQSLFTQSRTLLHHPFLRLFIMATKLCEEHFHRGLIETLKCTLRHPSSPQATSTLYLTEQFGEYPMEYESFRWRIMGFPLY
ncbi:hypothetical protein EDD85DRAFT_556119 [Armillaria nabsnona]|nr:hypothetical protein EDD85DRAFT_556119 [Armillaria nabsnona]